MQSLEVLSSNQSNERFGKVDPDKFWAILDPLLKERGVKPLDHIQQRVELYNQQIESMPYTVFDPSGGLNSPLLHSHRLLINVLSERQPFSEAVARAVFPYWREQLEDAEDFLAGY